MWSRAYDNDVLPQGTAPVFFILGRPQVHSTTPDGTGPETGSPVGVWTSISTPESTPSGIRVGRLTTGEGRRPELKLR